LSEALRADIGGSYIDAHLTQDVPAQGYHSGDRLPGAPKWNGTLGLQYQFKVLGRPAFVRGDAMYVGPFYNNVIQSPAGLAGDYVKVDAKARVIIDALNIDLYVRNLTDEDAYTNRPQMSAGVISSVKGYRMRPRTIGFQLGYNF
jgi:outer membrane receptor protein involved in Fe transport